MFTYIFLIGLDNNVTCKSAPSIGEILYHFYHILPVTFPGDWSACWHTCLQPRSPGGPVLWGKYFLQFLQVFHLPQKESHHSEGAHKSHCDSKSLKEKINLVNRSNCLRTSKVSGEKTRHSKCHNRGHRQMCKISRASLKFVH